jgi:predicted DNA-binding transcriptional regulator AlpA
MTQDIQTANLLLGGEYMTDKQTADFLGIHPRTLYRRYLERSGPPRIELGRKILYMRSSVIAWLDSCERQQVRARRLVRRRNNTLKQGDHDHKLRLR